jgi:hypothetical protein
MSVHAILIVVTHEKILIYMFANRENKYQHVFWFKKERRK